MTTFIALKIFNSIFLVCGAIFAVLNTTFTAYIFSLCIAIIPRSGLLFSQTLTNAQRECVATTQRAVTILTCPTTALASVDIGSMECTDHNAEVRVWLTKN